MITVKATPHARLQAEVADPRYLTKAEDMPPSTWTLAGIPRVGETIEDPETGHSFEVVRVVWWTDGSTPMLVVE